ncbi:hypothetical protein [Streptomyces sp. NPDC090022]|uniref:hypothetical protein n=1 Tax=Streptomyces sp. NPDC090022 TaxID=3365920 RepID=UPI00381FF532
MRKIITTACAAGAAAVLTAVAAAGTAVADEYHRDAHNGPTVALINTGQIDDPLEDVLEHVLLIGGQHTWS